MELEQFLVRQLDGMAEGQGKLGRALAMADNQRILAFHELEKSSNQANWIFFIGDRGSRLSKRQGIGTFHR